jgi:hypothetical protein
MFIMNKVKYKSQITQTNECRLSKNKASSTHHHRVVRLSTAF